MNSCNSPLGRCSFMPHVQARTAENCLSSECSPGGNWYATIPSQGSSFLFLVASPLAMSTSPAMVSGLRTLRILRVLCGVARSTEASGSGLLTADKCLPGPLVAGRTAGCFLRWRTRKALESVSRLEGRRQSPAGDFGERPGDRSNLVIRRPYSSVWACFTRKSGPSIYSVSRR